MQQQVRIDGLSEDDHRMVEEEARRRGMYVTRFRGELIRKGLESLRSEDTPRTKRSAR